MAQDNRGFEAGRQLRIDRLLQRLTWAGIACFLLISAFDIHRWRVTHWQQFDAAFAMLKGHLLAVPPQPLWLYAVGFPFIAVNFYAHVQILRGARRGILRLFVGSAAGIALVPLAGLQTVGYQMLWPELLRLAGYAIAGAIAIILAFRLDSRSSAIIDAPQPKD
ncbi:hypothetical protein PK98_07645 [Croceibacterium mercuriale]|uniref:Uncharacterized protein n=1 Tax=Croceibacterium mercuriale TaxID=1572751 RepID=A0A0B2C239_9SPHN|nr:hypothetical protein [Croceibacterium mercuriale]KHL26322.1 hypothetical protein PK98_07645 [Croceibacterium mercuriale]